MGTGELTQIIRPLRMLVLALGELSDHRWWRTGFLNETGFSFLARLYPRSSLDAAVYSAGKAACEVHDRAVGRQGSYHLFRLPEFIEAKIRDNSTGTSAGLDAESLLDSIREGRLLENLKDLGDFPVAKASGPVWIGAVSQIRNSGLFRETAAIYFNAFAAKSPAYPYFESDER